MAKRTAKLFQGSIIVVRGVTTAECGIPAMLCVWAHCWQQISGRVGLASWATGVTLQLSRGLPWTLRDRVRVICKVKVNWVLVSTNTKKNRGKLLLRWHTWWVTPSEVSWRPRWAAYSSLQPDQFGSGAHAIGWSIWSDRGLYGCVTIWEDLRLRRCVTICRLKTFPQGCFPHTRTVFSSTSK